MRRVVIHHHVGSLLTPLIASLLFGPTCLFAFPLPIISDVRISRPSLHSEDVILETPTGKLAGTLLTPSGKSKFAVVLIIAGSGLTDRNGNTVGASGKSDCLRMLAEGLASAGIGSLRYDKRGVGGSASARMASNAFDIYVDDAARWVTWLRGDPRVGSVGVVGHSEGAIVGALAAQRGGLNAVVSLAGAGSRFDEVISRQAESAERSGKLSKPATVAIKNAVAELRAGHVIKSRPKDLPDSLWSGLFNPRAQEFLISLFRYDPAVEFAKLPKAGVRVLVIQGSTDLMGPVSEANLLAAAVDQKPVIIEGMNHELKSAPLDEKANDDASEDPRRPLASGLLESIVSFLTIMPGS